MADLNTINWQLTPFNGVFDSRWTVTSGSISNGVLTLNVGGTAVLVLTTEVNKQFEYMKLASNFNLPSISTADDFTNNAYIFLQEVYKDSNNTPTVTRTRSVGLKPTTLNGDNYIDNVVVGTLNSTMYELKITIKNNSTSTLTFNTLDIYQSVDIPTSQINDVVNTMTKQGSAQNMRVYRNDDGSINGIGIIIQGSTNEIKFKPTYFNGQIVSIDTNYGQSIAIANITALINLSS